MSKRDKKKKKARGQNNDNDEEDERAILDAGCMPIARAVWDGDRPTLAPLLEPLLGLVRGTSKVTALCQTEGERFTGGRSTPIYELTVEDGDGTRHDLVIKLVLRRRPIQIPGPPPPSLRAAANDAWRTYAVRARSYEVEAGFYGFDDVRIGGGRPTCPCPAKALRSTVGLSLPEVLCVERGGAHAADGGSSSPGSAICFVMRDLRSSHPLHPKSMTPMQIRAALDWLAGMHARFWEAPRLRESHSDGWIGSRLWECGGFWGIQHRLRISAENDNDNGETAAELLAQRVESCWAATLRWLAKRAPDIADRPSVQRLGLRLGSCWPGLFRALHGEPSVAMNLAPVVYSKSSGGSSRRQAFGSHRRHLTLIHGDFKAANMFFCESREDIEQGDGSPADSCAVCDFQFAGPGLGSTDLAYLLFPDAYVDHCANEVDLLDWYYNRLGHHLERLGKGDRFDEFSRETLGLHYRLAQADFLAYSLALSGWVASAPPDVALVSAVDETLALFDRGEVLNFDGYEEMVQQRIQNL